MAEEAIVDTGSTHTDTSPTEASATVTPEASEQPGILPTAEIVEGAGGDAVVAEPIESVAPVAPIVPETYEFGEGADENLASEMSPLFKELGLTQEQASKLSDAYGQATAGKLAGDDDAFVKQVSDWEGELKNDPDFGGDNFAKNAGEVAAFLDATVPAGIKDGLKSMFETTGIGSHPAVVKYFHALSRLMPVREDNPANAFKAPGGAEKSTEDLMYPNG